MLSVKFTLDRMPPQSRQEVVSLKTQFVEKYLTRLVYLLECCCLTVTTLDHSFSYSTTIFYPPTYPADLHTSRHNLLPFYTASSPTQPNINHLPFKILLWANHRNLFTLGWLQGKNPKQIIDKPTREKKISFKELLTCWKGRDLSGRNRDFVFPVKRKFTLRGGSGHFGEQNTWTKSIRDASLHTSLWSAVWKSTANCARKRARASLTTPDYEKPSVKSTDSDKSYLMPYLDWAAIVKFILPSVLYPWALSPTVQALPPCQNLLFHLPAARSPVPL